jgi:hypothetical protein
MDNILLPNFLGIGAERSGTTWLYNILKSHPEVYLCPFKKEINFFSYHYNKGIEWYGRYFRNEDPSISYKAIGEITPIYIYLQHTPRIIAKSLPNSRFILILRNPVDRAISDYKFYKLNTGISQNFEELMRNKEEIYKKGLYTNQLKNWLEYFPKQRFLILIYEEMVRNPLDSLKKISEFLNIDLFKFDRNIIKTKVNSSGKPRLFRLFSLSSKLVHRISTFLTKYNRDKLIGYISYFRIFFYIFGTKKKKEEIPFEIKNQLSQKYRKDIESLEKLLECDLKIWKN